MTCGAVFRCRKYVRYLNSSVYRLSLIHIFVVSGIPASREIGLVKFLFGPVWNSNAAEPQFGILPFILTRNGRTGFVPEPPCWKATFPNRKPSRMNRSVCF